MNLTVTGGAGYIGSVCVEALCDAGHHVLVIDNLSEGHRAAVDPRAELLVADLADESVIASALHEWGSEAVIHFAALALVGESMEHPGRYFRNNVAGGLSLLEAMRAAGVPKIVFSSTCATYGIPDKVPIDEQTPQRPVNPYGESKLAFERIIHWFAECHGLEAVIFRYFNAAGAGRRCGEDHRIETHLIPNLLKVALEQRESAELYGTDYDTDDGTAVRDYIHVSDLADVHRLAVEKPVSGTFNLGTGRGHSVKEVIEVCRAVTGHEIPVIERPRRPGDPAALVADPSRVRASLGWMPQFTELDEIVQTAWDWHRAHPQGYAGAPAAPGSAPG